MFRKSLIVLLFAFCLSKMNAQKFELGKVSVAELAEKEHPKDHSAVAAILFNEGEVTYQFSPGEGFVMMTEVKTRIKIYKKEGYNWANQEMGYYIGGWPKESISISEAATYNLEYGKIVKSKLKSEGEFDTKVNRYWAQKRITLPNIKEGSVIEFRYVIKTASVGSLKEWNFQSSIPVNYSKYETYIPEYFIYKPNQKGFIFPKVTVEKSQKSIVVPVKDREGDLMVHTNFAEGRLDYEETKTTYLAENMPAMKEEVFVNNIDNYISSITNELSTIKQQNSGLKNFSTDWETVAKKIYENDDFGLELKKTGYFEECVDALIAGLKTQDEKITAIFDYVKCKVKWNNNYRYTCDDGVKKAFKDKTGNVAEINLMLTAMLRYAGIEANPVLLSTRANGIALFPNRYAFNYVIAAVEIQNDLILLDATEKFSIPNILPLRDLNWFGRLIRKDGSSVQVDLMPKTLSKEAVNMNIEINSDGVIKGKFRRQLTNQKSLAFRKKYSGTNNDSYLEKLENENNNIEISDYVRDNELDLSKPVTETYLFKDTKSAEIINDKIYIAPLTFLTQKENVFKQEVREYPVDFGFPVESKYYINIEIPEGYSVESLPKGINIGTGNDIGTFKYIIANADNKIQIQITADINAAIVPADFYDVLKDFWQKMIDKENEKIVLVKNKV